jgi:hypothetical protein
MSDPRIAALAEAYHNAAMEHGIGCVHPSKHGLAVKVRDCDAMAAAILAALPDDWCRWDDVYLRGLNEGVAAGEALVAAYGAEIARLRRIEEAARRHIDAIDDEHAGDWAARWLEARLDAEAALRAALEEKP